MENDFCLKKVKKKTFVWKNMKFKSSATFQ